MSPPHTTTHIRQQQQQQQSWETSDLPSTIGNHPQTHPQKPLDAPPPAGAPPLKEKETESMRHPASAGQLAGQLAGAARDPPPLPTELAGELAGQLAGAARAPTPLPTELAGEVAGELAELHKKLAEALRYSFYSVKHVSS
jgi:hypothetical protein